MKKYMTYAFVLVATLVAALPTAADASKAVKLTENTLLFTIDFSLSDENLENEVPIAAKYGVDYTDRVNYLGYTIESDDASAPQATNINALVLSDANVDGVRYVVPSGEETEFTLLILATFAEPLQENSYRARITKLPYFMDGKRTSVHQNQLDGLAMPTWRGN